MNKSFVVNQIDNGFLFQGNTGTFTFPNEKALVAHIRDYLGLPKQGAPKKAEVVELHAVN